ncbi:MAG TPA: RNB domain-containing ribonuclease [Thermoplasmata archaeon]|nr:RNB domain-containing ribonuclease [Thermoplasmata archaeon]
MLLIFKRLNYREASHLLLKYFQRSGKIHFHLEFKEHQLRAAERLPEDVEEEDLIGRKNLTHLETYTVDPVDAKDFDDAISFVVKDAQDKGNQFKRKVFELWVHIADVSHYVRPHNVVDDEARFRATSVYLPTGVLPMLPPKLSDNLCSLVSGKIRLAVSTRLVFDCERLLPEIARMGFDVLYFPPIHPIGRTNRKGRNNAPESRPEDPGSPWAIGSEEGGHKSVHPQLGTLEDFERLVRKAREFGIEIALDLAFQCSPDHPYLREHPSWFRRLPDGSIQYAENPPKRYEDVVPFDFETKDWKELWKELRSIVLFWVEKGIRIFRVDNPHTKPFSFWEWLINDVRKNHPDVIFLSEAFTRPKVMYRLAKLGFSQSYTYFTWRNTKKELVEYFTELTQTEVKEYFRPNLWPNTPDILPEYLQHGGRPAFITRLVLAATLSPNYGIYGPAFELCVDDAIPDKEEYLNSEKYEVKNWDRGRPDSLKELITRVNKIRKENPALQESSNLTFCDVDNDFLISYLRTTEDLSNVILVVVNLDPFNIQSGWLKLPLSKLCVEQGKPYLLHDLLSDEKHIWHQERNQITIDPKLMPAKVFSLKRRMRKESDFEYYL